MVKWGQTPSGRTLGNGLALFVGETFARLATFLMALIVARRFGPVALGQYGYAVSVASVLLLVPDLGLHLLTTRELATDPSRLRRMFWSLHWLKLLLVSGVAGFTLLIAPRALQDEGRLLLLYILLARALLQTFSQAYMAIFRAFERMHYIAFQQLVNAVVTVACAGVALAFQKSLSTVVACLLVGGAIEACLGWHLVRRKFNPGKLYGWDTAFLREMLAAAVPIGVTAVLLALNLRLDVLTLGIFASNLELGHFQAAAWFLVGIFLCASLLMSGLFPKLSRLLKSPSEKGSAYVESLLKHGTLAVALSSFTVWLGAPHLLAWIFGPALAGATGSLRILASAFPFMFINTVLFYVFVAARRRAVYLGALGFSVGLGSLLGILLAQRYGATGAAVADVIREFSVASFYLICLQRERVAPTAGRALLKVSVLAGCLALLAGLSSLPLWHRLEWPAAGTLMLALGTLIFVGFPSRRELVLLVDENS